MWNERLVCALVFPDVEGLMIHGRHVSNSSELNVYAKGISSIGRGSHITWRRLSSVFSHYLNCSSQFSSASWRTSRHLDIKRIHAVHAYTTTQTSCDICYTVLKFANNGKTVLSAQHQSNEHSSCSRTQTVTERGLKATMNLVTPVSRQYRHCSRLY